MDDVDAAQRERERIERLYGFGPETEAEWAERMRSFETDDRHHPKAAPLTNSGIGALDRFEERRRTSVGFDSSQSSVVPRWNLVTLKDIQLGWYTVFELAFRFTIALAVIGAVPFLILLFILTR